MHSSRWAQAVMSMGFLWFVVAIAFAPTNKIYQQGLVALLWLPTIALAWSGRECLGTFWREQRALCVALVLLALWASLSLVWSATDDGSRELKRMLYIGVFILFFPILAAGRTDNVVRLLQLGGVGLGVASAYSLYRYYGFLHAPWFLRLEGIGELSHPILGAYVIGVALVWSLLLPPQRRLSQVIWLCSLLLCLAFVVMSQSRGALLALALTVALLPLWWRDRRAWIFSGTVLVLGVIGLIVFQSLMTDRGSSYRPEIFGAVLQMIELHPLKGLGIGTNYSVTIADGQVFDHSHNLFTHTTILLGLPGLVLWSVVWLLVLREAWLARSTALGRCMMGVWIFSTCAMQFDAASLTGSPRAEWFISWLPIGLACVLVWARAPRHAVVKSRVQFNQ